MQKPESLEGMMDTLDALIIVMALVGGLSVAAILSALVADFLWPWAAGLLPRRPQATRRPS